MTGRGTAQGAGTIVNAFATGKGVAFGLRAHVAATVEPHRTNVAYHGRRRLGPAEGRLVLETQRAVQNAIGHKDALRVRVECDIPPKRGLKSSSAVGVAVARAVADHHQAKLADDRLLKLVADAAIKSKTSLTGALDDAAACALGGVVHTDNSRRRILRRDRLPDGLVAVVHVPQRATATGSLRRKDFRSLAPILREAWYLAESHAYREAMLVNTLAYAPRLGVVPRFSLRALEAGAWAAGLSGKGPAEIALAHPAEAARIQRRNPRARRTELNHGGDDA